MNNLVHNDMENQIPSLKNAENYDTIKYKKMLEEAFKLIEKLSDKQLSRIIDQMKGERYVFNEKKAEGAN